MVARKASRPKPVSPERFEIFLVNLDPTIGAEITKTRPCVVISPDEANAYIRTVVIAPLSTGSHQYPTRVPCTFQRKAGHVVIDQLRTVDRARLVKKLGVLDTATQTVVLRTLADFFAP